MVAIAACLLSCRKQQVIPEEKFSQVDYARSNVADITKMYTPTFDWETQTTIPITDGTSKILPWFSSANTSVPLFILNDYKKEDGWELMYNLCQYPGEASQNYLIFYNKFTGTIRSYYNLVNTSTSGTNGMWGLELSGSNSLLNGIGHFTSAINEPQNSPLAISTNITLQETTKAVNQGWNAFDTEITYDPLAVNNSILMRVISYDQNIQNLALSGNISLTSEGTIATMNTKNPLQNFANNAAKSAGSEAGSWIKDNVGLKVSNKFIKLAAPGLGAIASGGVTEIVKAGINLLFGTFIGKKSTTSTSTQKIEFKTNGTLSLTGTISSSSGNNVSAAANLWFPGTQEGPTNFLVPYYQKQLGTWNLPHAPVIRVPLKAYSGGGPEYTRVISFDHSSVNVVINPDLLTEIDHYEVVSDVVYYKKFKGQTNWENSSPMFNRIDDLLYDDGENEFYTRGIENFSGPVPPYTPPDVPIEMPNIIVNEVDKRYVVKVTVTMYPKTGYNLDPIVITRSYLPTYEFY